MDYTNLKNHIIYIAHNQDREVMYIGSSSLPIDQLEHNHRNFAELGYKETKFRKALSQCGECWAFSVLYKANCTREEIEEIEGHMIRKYTPKYNDDLDPLTSSQKYGRI